MQTAASDYNVIVISCLQIELGFHNAVVAGSSPTRHCNQLYSNDLGSL